MAYATLVAPELTPELVRAGGAFLQQIDAVGIAVPAAFWLFSPEDAGWRLVLASPEVSEHGSRNFYVKIFDLLQAAEDSAISASFITAATPDDPLVRLLRSALTTGPGITNLRFTGNVIDGVLIPDALIYRLP